MSKKNFEAIRAVTLDAEGTLVHPYPSVGIVYAGVLSRHGIDVDADNLERSFREAFAVRSEGPRAVVNDTIEMEFWREVVGQTLEGLCSSEQFDLVFKELHQEFGRARCWRLVDDAFPTIETLKRRGYLVGILSNWDTRLRQVMAELEVMPLFDACFISCEIGAEKPDQRIFQHVEKELSLKPDSILHVGNSAEQDGEGARKAGWHYFLVCDGSGGASPGHPGIRSLGAVLDYLPGVS